MANIIDLHVGRRLTRRRRLLGLTQQQVAESVQIGHQQIQKYEAGTGIPVHRLYRLAIALNVPLNYFFEGLQAQEHSAAPISAQTIPEDILNQKETLNLVRLYSQLDEPKRRRLMDTAKALQDSGSTE